MNNNTFIAIVAVVIIAGSLLLVNEVKSPTSKLPGGSDAGTFSGTISAVETGCFADGICSVTVDGKRVIVMAGFRMSPPPVGRLIGVESIGDLEGKIGAYANVYATSTPEGDFTLYGNEDYYVEVTGNDRK